MKKIIIFLMFMGTTLILFAQQIDSLATSPVASQNATNGTSFKEIILSILIFGGALFIIAHMLYILFKGRRFPKDNFTVNYFQEARQRKELPTDSSETENSTCWEALQNAYMCWSNIEIDEENDEYRKPKKMKEIIKSGKFLDQVVDLAPTDIEVIKTLNEYKEVVRTNEERSFNGSWKLIILGLILTVVVGLITKSEARGFILSTLSYGAFFWVPVIVYYISGLTPQFLIEKREKRGGGNVSSGLVLLALGILGGGQTIRYKYSDGSTEDDNSQHVIALIIGVIALVIVALTIFIWAIVNYLRNYVLYF